MWGCEFTKGKNTLFFVPGFGWVSCKSELQRESCCYSSYASQWTTFKCLKIKSICLLHEVKLKLNYQLVQSKMS